MRFILEWLLVSSLLLISRYEGVIGHGDHEHSHDKIDDEMDDFDDVIPESSEADIENGGDEAFPEDVPPTVKPRERPIYSPPTASGSVYFADAFISESDFKKRWVLSRAKKDATDDAIAKYDGVWSVEEPTDNPLQQDLGLVLKSRAKHHAIAAELKKPFEFTGKAIVIQYEVKFQNGQECGGGYIKLLSSTNKLDLAVFNDKTDYTIMFGPDKCGMDSKLHFIFRHKNPITGVYEEKHAKKPSAKLETFFTDKKTHLYTLVIKSDNSFEIYVDQNLINSGSLLEDMTPPVNPSKEITDPEDKKPADWDDKERITDREATKPDDWDESEPAKIIDASAVKPDGWLDDEPELIADLTAEKPSDWDDDMDGEWEAAMISNPACESGPGCGPWKAPETSNPKYKGLWSAPMIDNPNYKGKWTARMIPNPHYFEDLEPFKMTPISAIGLELWSMSDDILFDNFFISEDKQSADKWAADSWELKHEQEAYTSSEGGVVQSVIDATNEHPWLWAVIAVVVILPIVLFVVCCCMPGSKPSEEHVTSAARRKKTDEPTGDTEVNEYDDDEEEEEEEQGGDEERLGDIDNDNDNQEPPAAAAAGAGKNESKKYEAVGKKGGKKSETGGKKEESKPEVNAKKSESEPTRVGKRETINVAKAESVGKREPINVTRAEPVEPKPTKASIETPTTQRGGDEGNDSSPLHDVVKEKKTKKSPRKT